ncbi:MAG TPA: hypothetical protein VJT82_10150 [Pyrinomonadaceae bacterium]|nr:hypothetical protein [Pyrinomonadaceae bacterium]
MRKMRLLSGLIACVLASGANVLPNTNQRASRRKPKLATVCFDPTAPCKTVANFEPNDLPFRIPPNAVIYESEFFYAIILKSIRVTEEDCANFIPEAERLQTQALFPKQKVFSSRCSDPASIYYTGVAPNTRMMAVYAGATRAQAERTLAQVKATGKFPGANIRRMQAGFNGT